MRWRQEKPQASDADVEQAHVFMQQPILCHLDKKDRRTWLLKEEKTLMEDPGIINAGIPTGNHPLHAAYVQRVNCNSQACLPPRSTSLAPHHDLYLILGVVVLQKELMTASLFCLKRYV